MERVDETNLVTLAGGTRPEANAKFDRGAVPAGLGIRDMMLVLRRPPETEQALVKFIDELHNPSSSNFHHWLNAEEYGERFGVNPDDVKAITDWLESHGLKVNLVYPNGMFIDFTGTAGQVKAAFHTEIHNLQVNGTMHIANMSDPKIPAALAPAVFGIASLNNFYPHPMLKKLPDITLYDSGSNRYFAPPDLATIYNLNPLFGAGVTGKGTTIALLEDTDLQGSACSAFTHKAPCPQADLNEGNGAWNVFRKIFGLARTYPYATMTQIQPQPPTGGGPYQTGPDGYVNCYDPGANADDGEAVLDVEWASAAAPNATILMIACDDYGTPNPPQLPPVGGFTSVDFGGFLGLQNLLNSPGPYPDIVSISYGTSEEFGTASYNNYTMLLYQQAVAQGVSVFVASGDEGADSSDADLSTATEGISASNTASTVYNVAVGGTDFEDVYNAKCPTSACAGGGPPQTDYWSATNSANLGSALSYIPEIPWNDSCGSLLRDLYQGYLQAYGSAGYCNHGGSHSVVAGSGAPSNCATGSPDPNFWGILSGTCAGWPKPSWQSGILGNPSDGVRDIPDISMFASQGPWGHALVYCSSRCPTSLSSAGGTSFAAPISAGIQALVNQYTGQRWGNPNVVYYRIANAQFTNALFANSLSACNSSINPPTGPDSRCVFHDVTQGDITLGCIGQNCYGGGANAVSPITYGALAAGPTTLDFLTLSTIPFWGGTIVSAPGSGYAGNPTCTLSGGGGSEATCSATTGTSVVSLSVTAGGSGYTSTPACSISGGGGSGATCTASRNSSGTVTGVTLTAGGSGYTSNPACAISGGGGTGATCNALADGVVSITLTNAGTGYIAPPDCTLSAPPSGGTQATCLAALGATSFQPAYPAGVGWDFATGIGTVNGYNLVTSPYWSTGSCIRSLTKLGGPVPGC